MLNTVQLLRWAIGDQFCPPWELRNIFMENLTLRKLQILAAYQTWLPDKTPRGRLSVFALDHFKGQQFVCLSLCIVPQDFPRNLCNSMVESKIEHKQDIQQSHAKPSYVISKYLESQCTECQNMMGTSKYQLLKGSCPIFESYLKSGSGITKFVRLSLILRICLIHWFSGNDS